jgi:hypothetical protein
MSNFGIGSLLGFTLGKKRVEEHKRALWELQVKAGGDAISSVRHDDNFTDEDLARFVLEAAETVWRKNSNQ